MRKLSRREKFILKLLGATLLIAGVLEVEARYRQSKENLVLEIESQRSKLSTYLEKLKTNITVDGYQTKSLAIEAELEEFRDRVLELPRESDATLLIKETIDDKGAEFGMSINSISSRKSKELVKDQPMRELKTYFAFDTNLENMLEFFDAMSNQGYFLVIDNMSLGTRKRVSRRGRRKNTKTKERPPLNGNAVLTTLFLIDSEGSLESYLDGAKNRAPKPAADPGPKKTAKTTPPGDKTASKSTTVKLPPREQNGSEAQVNPLQSLGNQAQLISPSTQATDGPPPKKADPLENPLQNIRVQPQPRRLTDTAKKKKTRF